MECFYEKKNWKKPKKIGFKILAKSYLKFSLEKHFIALTAELKKKLYKF